MSRGACRGGASAARARAAGAAPILASIWVLVGAARAESGVSEALCPPDAIAIEPGDSVQSAVHRAGDGAAFCLKNGVYHAQAIRPRAAQRFYGEGHAILNGSRLLLTFGREGRLWFADDQRQRGQRRGR